MPARKPSFTTLLLFAAVASAAGCGGGGDGAPPTQSVQTVTLSGIRVSPSGAPTLAVPLGDLQFTATGTYSDGSTADLTGVVTWSSSNASVATTSATGLATMLAEGSAEISASDAETGLVATVAVTVLPAALLTLDVSPIDPTILMGSSLQLGAWGALADDVTTTDYTGSVAWTSSDETVATVSAAGLVQGVSLGAATITATDPVTGAAASTTVSVTDVLGLSYVALSRGSVVGGGAVQVGGLVALTAITPLDVTVTLWSTDAAVVGVPASVVVAAGTDRASFAVTTSSVSQKTRVYVWASDGTTEKRASLNVRKAR